MQHQGKNFAKAKCTLCCHYKYLMYNVYVTIINSIYTEIFLTTA